MTHNELELQMDAYVDGELAPQDARQFEAHLKDCRDCARLHDERVALGAGIRAELPPLRAPDGLRTKVRAAIRSAASAPRNTEGVPSTRHPDLLLPWTSSRST